MRIRCCEADTTRGNLNCERQLHGRHDFHDQRYDGGGNYYLILKAECGRQCDRADLQSDGRQLVAEADETDNTQAVGIAAPGEPESGLTVTNGAMGAVG